MKDAMPENSRRAAFGIHKWSLTASLQAGVVKCLWDSIISITNELGVKTKACCDAWQVAAVLRREAPVLRLK